MSTESPFASIPDAPTLEKRFSFVESEVTRQNLTFCFQYIIFLTVIRSLQKQHGPIALSVNRDIVVHTGSIIESCLNYAVKRMLKLGLADDTKLPKTWVNKGQGNIHEFSEVEKIVWIKQNKEGVIFKENPNSKDINLAARAIELLDDTLYEKAESIRKARNNIHFITDDKGVEYPIDDEVDEFFGHANELLTTIEQKLSTEVTEP